jgi:hypothetical protein
MTLSIIQVEDIYRCPRTILSKRLLPHQCAIATFLAVEASPSNQQVVSQIEV